MNFDMISSYSLANGEVYALGSMKNTPAALAKMGADLAGSLGDSATDLATYRKNAKVSQLGCTD